MGIMEEAEQHIMNKRRHFISGLAQKIEPLEDFIYNNMGDTMERDKALEHLTEVLMWCKRYTDIHGLE